MYLPFSVHFSIQVSRLSMISSIWLELPLTKLFIPEHRHIVFAKAITGLFRKVDYKKPYRSVSLQWRHNVHDGVLNHQLHDCLFNRLFRRRSKKTSKLRVTALCAGNSPVTGEIPAQRASNAENIFIDDVPLFWYRLQKAGARSSVTCTRGVIG